MQLRIRVFRTLKKEFYDQLPGGKYRNPGGQLKSHGVTIVDEITAYEYGKFVHILDPEGNAIELFEPGEEKMG